ncbi:MAG: tetratricopeptide repeat protein [Brevinematia bacterium]
MLRRILFTLVFLLISNILLFPDEVINRVSNYILKLDYNSAIDELERALNLNPQNVEYYYYIIDLSLDIGDINLAKMYLDKLKVYYRDDVNIKIYEMEIFRLKGDVSSASSISKNLLKLDWVKTNEMFIIFYSKLLAENNVSEAVRFLLPYTKVYKDNYKILMTMAYLYLKFGKLKEAKFFLDKTISINRFDKNIYYLYGEYYYMLKDFSNAIKYLEKVILFPGPKDRAYYLLSESFYNIRNYKKSLEYARSLKLLDESIAKLLFDAGDYNILIKNYKDSDKGVVRFFVEESLIKLYPYDIPSIRSNYSEKNYEIAMKLKKKGVPYYEIFLRRAIRLNPYNYLAWYELGNYYRYFFSPYYSLEELSFANSLFVNSYQLQDYLISLSRYVSNYSKLSSWKIDLKQPKNFDVLIKFHDVKNASVSNYFLSDIIKYSFESWKIHNVRFSIALGEVSKKDYNNYDIILEVYPEVFNDYLNVRFLVISPREYVGLTNFYLVEKIDSDILPKFYYDSEYAFQKILPAFGRIVGFDEKFLIVKFFNKKPLKDKEVVITKDSFDKILKGEYKVFALGKVVDSDGEYGLIELNDKYKFLTKLENDMFVFIP